MMPMQSTWALPQLVKNWRELSEVLPKAHFKKYLRTGSISYGVVEIILVVSVPQSRPEVAHQVLAK